MHKHSDTQKTKKKERPMVSNYNHKIYSLYPSLVILDYLIMCLIYLKHSIYSWSS